MKLDYHLLSVVALLCICQFGFSDTQQIVGSENAANVGRDLDLYFLDDEDSREPLNTHHMSKREAVPSRKAPKKKKESASPAESLMGSGDSEDSDDTEDSSKVFTPPSDDEDGEDIDGSGDIFSVKPKTSKKPRVSTPPPIRGENSRPSANTPSSSTTSTTTTSTAMPPTTTSTTTEEPTTSTAVPTTMRAPTTRRPSPSGPVMPEDDEDSEDDGDYEGSGAGESPIVKGHVNVPKKPYGANRHSTAKPKNGDASILPPTDYDIDEDGDPDGDDDDDDEEDSDDDFPLSTPKSLAPSSTVEPSSTTSTTTPSPTTTASSTTTEISTTTSATEVPKSTTPASVAGVDDDSVGGDDDDDEDEDPDMDENEDNDDALRKTQDKHNKNENNNNGVDNSNDSNNNANINVNHKVNKEPPKIEDNSEDNDIVHDKEEDNLIPGGTSREVHLSRHKATQRPSTLLGQPGILVAIMGGAVVGLLLAILCVMFVVYRMRKKDEGSFPLGKRTHDDHFSTHRRHYMRPSANKEFYA